MRIVGEATGNRLINFIKRRNLGLSGSKIIFEYRARSLMISFVVGLLSSTCHQLKIRTGNKNKVFIGIVALLSLSSLLIYRKESRIRHLKKDDCVDEKYLLLRGTE